MIQSQVWTRVLRLLGERQRPGTGFLIDIKDTQYLVTARHLLTEERQENLILQQAYLNGGKPFMLNLERVGSLTGTADVGLFHLPTRLVEGMPVDASREGIIFTQDVYILGFPAGLSLQIDKSSTQDLPLAKHGILSGVKYDPSGDIYFVDTIANPGFSGGPMVYKHLYTDSLRFGGVVKGQYTQSAISDSEPSTGPPTPAGITAVTDISEVLALVH